MSYLIWLCTVCQCPIKWWINPCPAETGYVIFRKESKSRISWLNLVNTSVDMRSRSDCFPDSIRFHWKTEVNVPYSYLCSRTRVKALISRGQQKLVKLTGMQTFMTWPHGVLSIENAHAKFSVQKGLLSWHTNDRHTIHILQTYLKAILNAQFEHLIARWLNMSNSESTIWPPDESAYKKIIFKLLFQNQIQECSGSVVECLTRDRWPPG